MLQVLVNAAALGSVYLLVATGLILIFGQLGIPNFAHGKVMVTSGFVWVYLNGKHLDIVYLVVLSIAASVAASVLLYLLLYRPLRKNASAMLLGAFGVVLIFQSIGDIIAGPLPRGMKLTHFQGVWLMGSVYIPQINVAVLVLTGAAVLVLVFLLRHSMWGIRIRALGEDRRVTTLLGVSVDIVALQAFALAGALAGIAGLCWAALYGVAPSSDLSPLLIAFTGVVVGGLGSILGAGLACYGIAVAQSMAAYYGYAGWSDGLVFALLFALLVARPAGIRNSAAALSVRA
jgi:branched-chain amino acid transport system permease protein